MSDPQSPRNSVMKMKAVFNKFEDSFRVETRHYNMHVHLTGRVSDKSEPQVVRSYFVST